MLKSIIRPIITLWEKIFSWAENIKPVEGSPYGLLRMSVHPYKGLPATLDDETKISPGDYVLELHISNLTLAQGVVAGIEVTSDIQLLRLFREEIAHLAQQAHQGKLDPRIKAIWGVSMMGPALRRLGFTLEPMKEGMGSKMIVMWMTFLKWVFSPKDAKTASRKKRKRQGYQYWMSLEQLINRYVR
ncbi:MAG: YkoP family protein [Caldicoprobacterales bacterium]|jgi:hypothetical protein|nr:hypothetical protein [Clostridiales bacterium]